MTRTRLLVTGGAVLDPTGTSFETGLTVICAGDTIEAVLPDAQVVRLDSDVTLDVGGAFVVPGLIDAHFHLVSRSATVADEDVVAIGTLEGVLNAQERLYAGVTTVRDAGCRHRGIFALNRAIEHGLVPGPRAFVAGRNPTGPGAPVHWRNVVVRGENEMRDAVRTQLDLGANWIKCVVSHAEDPTEWGSVTQYLSESELRAAVEVAHERGARISIHCEGAEISAMAVRCGVDALEHAPLIEASTAEMMAERATVYVPTLWAFSDDAGIDLDALAPQKRQRLLYWRAEHLESVARASELGVAIAAGSDAVGSLPRRDVLVNELEALNKAGLDNIAALNSATRVGGLLVGGPTPLGVLEARSGADMVITMSNPHVAWDALRNPKWVISRGAIVVDNSTGSLRPERDLESAFASTTDRWVTDDPAMDS